MLVILTWEEPKWHVFGVEPKVDAEGDSIEEAFVAFYGALKDEGAARVEVVHDHRGRDQVGLYHIQIREAGPGELRVHSADILGLSLAGPAEDVMLALPGKVSELLSEQGVFNRHT